jgi:kynurenine formamidase
VTPALLDQVAAAERVEIRGGDILLIRTGWMEWYCELTSEARGRLQGSLGAHKDPLESPGLDPQRATAAWLWDHRIAAIASDNLALEALPVRRDDGYLPYRVIPLLGLPVGEMWVLDELANVCCEAGRYEFLLTSGVLRVPKGVGSPANAYAVL